MIPGDIDLTENLDFRKSRRKELPSLPWSNISLNNDGIIITTNYVQPMSSLSQYDNFNIYYDDIITEELWIDD